MIYSTEIELRDKVCEKVYEVYEVFKNFFGEEFTDLQNLPNELLCLPGGVSMNDLPSTEVSDDYITAFRTTWSGSNPFIIVYWPKVTVTNEHDRSVDIYELYAKIEINLEGKIPYECRGFTLNRSRYSLTQFMSGYDHRGYMHSHICSIPKDNLSQFQIPCLGTGPINSTIGSLKNSCDEITWMLFCQELAMYVTVESLRGIPYNKLEELGTSYALHNYSNYFNPGNYIAESISRRFRENLSEGSFKDFIAYYLENGHLNICYEYGVYGIGMPFFDFIIDISNAFINFFNQYYKEINPRELFEDGMLVKTIVSDGKFYQNSVTSSMEDVSRYIGQHVLRFKGRDITLTIDEGEDFNPIVTTVLDSNIAMYILKNILTVINYRYKNEHNSQNRRTKTSSAYQNVRYL